MWIEYLNRGLGVLIGIFIIATFIVFPFENRNPVVLMLTHCVINGDFSGWLGSIVVESELMPGMITLHMLLAMILLSF